MQNDCHVSVVSIVSFIMGCCLSSARSTPAADLHQRASHLLCLGSYRKASAIPECNSDAPG